MTDIQQIIDIDYATDVRKSRRKTVHASYPFSVCLMNPPYEKDTHLKFLEKTIQLADDVVSIQPVRWLQDPHLKKQKFVKSIGEHIISLETINQDDAAHIFNARLSFDLGIYHCAPNNTDNDKEFDIDDYSHTIDGINVKPILKKIKEKTTNTFNDVIEYNKLNGIRCRVDLIRPLPTFDPRHGKLYNVNWKGAYRYRLKTSYIFIDGQRDGKWWCEFGNRNQFTKEKGSPIPCSIKFDTKEEAHNFEESLETIFMQFIKRAYQRDVHVPVNDIPFMNDYKKPWTDERFKEYFEINDNEWNDIRKIMNKYI